MVDELDKEDVEAEGSEEAEETGMSGGPGDEATDHITNPTEEDLASRPEGEVEAAEEKPKYKFKSWDEAEKAHANAEKKMRESNEELARYRKMLTEGGKTTRTEQPVPQRKPVWQRERETFDSRVKAIPRPGENASAEEIEKYNTAVKDEYFKTHSEFAEIAQTEKTRERQTQDRMWGWIETEARKYGMNDDVFELRNEDGTTEKGTLANVFLGVAANPEAFGIAIRDASGRVLPLGVQVKAIAVGINRFIDAIILYRQNQTKKAAKQTADLTVLRRGSSGPSRKAGEEEASIETFAQGLESYKKGRRKAGDLRRRGGD